MIRRVLIITNPGRRGEDGYLEGVSHDVRNYKSFFKSAVGGAWREDEIIVLTQPTRARAKIEVKEQRNADYSITIFTGHGYHDASSDSTIVELAPDVGIDSRELRIGSDRHALILDCCRRLHIPEVVEDLALILEKAAKATITKTECRKYYDKSINNCPESLVVLYSCGLNEYSTDISGRGGLYSSSLVRGAEAWSRSENVDTKEYFETMSIAQAHKNAAREVSARSGYRQKPEIEKPRLCGRNFDR